MALIKTNLLIQMAPIPATFKGTPQEFSEEMVRRMAIVSPTGTNFIFIGDTEPSSNVGPWLRNGTQWWVFDDEIKRYVPLDISESEKTWFHYQSTVPTTSDPPVWLRITAQNKPVGWYVFDGTNWIPYNSIVMSGPTSSRPTSPVEFQQFYDSDISCLIWYERGAWRTVSGVPGDVKHVAYTTLSEALGRNPGWSLLGAANQGIRGRWISQATKDPGTSPATDLTTSPGVAHRAAFETYGETDGVDINPASPVPYPPTIALWTLVKD